LPPVLALIITQVLTNVLFFGFAYLFGNVAWVAARRHHQLEVQAEQLRQARSGAEERAVFGERVRIARELHDVVAHHVSVMGVQAAAGRRVMDRDPAKARTALAAIEQSARVAVDELRRMLGALRAPGQSGGPDQGVAGAGIERVEELVARVRDTGRAAQYAVFGDPLPLPDSVSQSAYRIVQEALTNTLKHAGAATVDIRVRYLAEELEIDVADDGRGVDRGAERGGMGIIGMRERVAVHDGTLEVGPRLGGGFRVRARLPYARGRAGGVSVAEVGIVR
jgi:signal transduction histidine kinase